MVLVGCSQYDESSLNLDGRGCFHSTSPVSEKAPPYVTGWACRTQQRPPVNTRPDSTRQRHRQALRPLSAAVRHFAPYPRLYLYRLDMPPGLPLYGPDTSRMARALVNQTFPTAPAYWKLERGECGNLHLHVISPLPPVAVPGAAHHAPVHDLPGLMAYLSKPADARLCRPGKLTPWTPDQYARARNYRAALDEYAAARRAALVVGRLRLSPCSGWVNVQRYKPRPLSPLLVVSLARLLVSLVLVGFLTPALPAPRSAARKPRSVRLVRSVARPRPPPRIGQEQAR